MNDKGYVFMPYITVEKVEAISEYGKKNLKEIQSRYAKILVDGNMFEEIETDQETLDAHEKLKLI